MDNLWMVSSFNDYLEEQPAGSVVGVVHDDCHCPLAEYLLARTGNLHMINGKHAYDLSDDVTSSVPAWGENFVYVVDHEMSLASYSPITREEALKALEIACDME